MQLYIRLLSLLWIVSVCCAFEWGKIFNYPLVSTNLNLTCQHGGSKLCCETTDPSLGFYPRKISNRLDIHDHKISHFASLYRHCSTHIVYIPSPYENLHMAAALNFSNNANAQQKLDHLIRFIWDDIPHAVKWLRRIAVRSTQQNSRPIDVTDDDQFYLSQFRYEVHCPGNASSISWTEWIEPLVVQARHPLTLMRCKPMQRFIEPIENTGFRWFSTGETHVIDPIDQTVLNTDYVLVANSREAYLRHVFRLQTQQHGRNQSSSSSYHQALSQKQQQRHHAASSHLRGHHNGTSSTHSSSNVNTIVQGPPSAYFFDAGSSRFDSSSYWFVCSYAQQNIAFDHMYGWEMTLLEPEDYWKKIPPPITPLYSFYNHPVSLNEQDAQSLIGHVKFIANKADFVSVKLDIDTSSIELPIAVQVLKDTSLHELIDEFFFEFHFRCQIMMFCGWGQGVVGNMEGMDLNNRSVILNFFQELRFKGIRSHIWP